MQKVRTFYVHVQSITKRVEGQVVIVIKNATLFQSLHLFAKVYLITEFLKQCSHFYDEKVSHCTEKYLLLCIVYITIVQTGLNLIEDQWWMRGQWGSLCFETKDPKRMWVPRMRIVKGGGKGHTRPLCDLRWANGYSNYYFTAWPSGRPP